MKKDKFNYPRNTQWATYAERERLSVCVFMCVRERERKCKRKILERKINSTLLEIRNWIHMLRERARVRERRSVCERERESVRGKYWEEI